MAELEVDQLVDLHHLVQSPINKMNHNFKKYLHIRIQDLLMLVDNYGDKAI